MKLVLNVPKASTAKVQTILEKIVNLDITAQLKQPI